MAQRLAEAHDLLLGIAGTQVVLQLESPATGMVTMVTCTRKMAPFSSNPALQDHSRLPNQGRSANVAVPMSIFIYSTILSTYFYIPRGVLYMCDHPCGMLQCLLFLLPILLPCVSYELCGTPLRMETGSRRCRMISVRGLPDRTKGAQTSLEALLEVRLLGVGTVLAVIRRGAVGGRFEGRVREKGAGGGGGNGFNLDLVLLLTSLRFVE